MLLRSFQASMHLQKITLPYDPIPASAFVEQFFCACILTTDRDIIHVMCNSAANFLLLFMSHLLLAWIVLNVPEQPFSYNPKELANMR